MTVVTTVGGVTYRESQIDTPEWAQARTADDVIDVIATLFCAALDVDNYYPGQRARCAFLAMLAADHLPHDIRERALMLHRFVDLRAAGWSIGQIVSRLAAE